MGKRECNTKFYCWAASNYMVDDQSDLVLKNNRCHQVEKNVSLIS